MNGAFLLNVAIALAGGAVLLAIWFLGGRYLPEHHWLRKWTLASVERMGPLEVARMLGVVLLMGVVTVLSIVYS